MEQLWWSLIAALVGVAVGLGLHLRAQRKLDQEKIADELAAWSSSKASLEPPDSDYLDSEQEAGSLHG